MPNGQCPIHQCLCTLSPSFELYQFLIKSEWEKSKFQQSKNSEGETPMHLACLWRNPAVVKNLIQNNPQTMKYENISTEWTAVHYAVAGNETCQKAKDFQFNAKTATILETLYQADQEYFKFQILKPGKTPNLESGLHMAALSHDSRVIRILVEANSSVLDIRDKNQETPFHYACRRYNSEENKTISSDNLVKTIGVLTYRKSANLFAAKRKSDEKAPLDLIEDIECRERIKKDIMGQVQEESKAWLAPAPVYKFSPDENPIKPKGNAFEAFLMGLACCGGRNSKSPSSTAKKYDQKAFSNVPQQESVTQRLAKKLSDAMETPEEPQPRRPKKKSIDFSVGGTVQLKRQDTKEELIVATMVLQEHAKTAEQIEKSTHELDEVADVIAKKNEEMANITASVKNKVDETNHYVEKGKKEIEKAKAAQDRPLFHGVISSKDKDDDSLGLGSLAAKGSLAAGLAANIMP